MGNRREYLINGIVDICQKLDQKGFVANHDGNVSVKYEDVLLATPTAEAKASITPEMIISCNYEGKKVEGIGNPFSEIKLHLAAYNTRDDAVAVVHAHPPFSTARGLINRPLENSLPEAVVSIGDVIPVAPYAMPGSLESEKSVEEAFGLADVIMIEGNGVLAIGKNLEEAYLRLELLEHMAKIDYYASTQGRVLAIPEDDMDKLLKKRASLGLGPKKTSDVADKVLQQYGQIKDLDNKHLDQLKELITQEVNKIIR
jgi:L-fuculose-phosphate aldolase